MNKIIYGLCIAFFTAVLIVGGDYAYAQAIHPNSGGGGVSQATGNTLWCQLTGCTMTGATTYSGITNDITTGTNEALRFRPNGTGNIILQSGNSQVDFEFASGNTTLRLDAATGMFSNVFSGNNSGILMTGITRAGATSNIAATAPAFVASDTLPTSSGVSLFGVYGEGMLVVERRQSATCASDGAGTPGALTLTPTSSVVLITNSDANGCVVTLAEPASSAGLGADVRFVVVSTAGGTVTFPDVANIHDGPAFATTTGLGLNDSYTVHYTDAADDLFVGAASSDN